MICIQKLTFTLGSETIPPVCSKANYECKIDTRVTVPAKKLLDLGGVEYAKNPSPSKYYKDKIKTVLCWGIICHEPIVYQGSQQDQSAINAN